MIRSGFLMTSSLSTAFTSTEERGWPIDRVIHKDVAILGGGGSGAYAAVRLREDYDTDIVVIEKANRLGGHAETYRDPVTNLSLNIGVQVYTPYGPARDFFSRFDLATESFLTTLDSNTTTLAVDIADGRKLLGYRPPSVDDVAAATKIWLNLSRKYEDAMTPGLLDFFPAEDIPDELLLPFGDFARKHGIEALAPRLATTANVGVGGFEKISTWQVMAFAFGVPVTQAIVDNSFFVPNDAPNTILYDRIYSKIEDDVMLRSQVVAAHRDGDGVRLVVQHDDGTTTLVKAKRLLVSFQPTLPNLAPLGLDDGELGFFETLTPTWLYVGILKIPFVPHHMTVDFIASAAIPDNHLAIRDTPSSFAFTPTGPASAQLFQLYWTSNYSVTHDDVRAEILKHIAHLLDAGTFEGSMDDVEILDLKDHNSVLWRQCPEEARTGLVQKANALQGHRATWWTGGLWTNDFSADVWAFTESMLPMMMGREA